MKTCGNPEMPSNAADQALIGSIVSYPYRNRDWRLPVGVATVGDNLDPGGKPTACNFAAG
ncbi:hypothetical protein BH23CHL5_BH23CHL5_23760 [soil metagenome]